MKKKKNYAGPEISSVNKQMTKEEIKTRFDNETASLYTDQDVTWIPEYLYMLSLIQKTLRPYVNSGSNLIDLGAGTGNLSRTIFRKYPDVNIDLVDFSENMLKQVDKVLTGFKGKYQTIQDDIFKIQFENDIYDCVMSSFAIHHGRGKEVYEELYRNIYKWLKKTGIFINCDVVEGDNDFLTKLNENGWSDYLKNTGFENVEIEKIFNNYHREDSPISLKSHMELLSKAGFETVDILWKKHNFAVYVGIK